MSRPELRYMVHPGWVRSRHDGQSHWVSGPDLVQLYQVDPRECVLYSPERWRGLSHDTLARLIHLYPDSTGAYQLSPPAPG